MPDGQRRYLRVRHQISRRAEMLQRLEHLLDVVPPGFKNLRGGLRQPGPDVLRCFGGRHRIVEHAGVRADSQESEHNHRRDQGPRASPSDGP